MGIWTDRVVPRIVDKALATDEITELRTRVCAGLHGTVLELGFGSGRNIGHYPAEVTEVHAVEPSDVGWALSAERRARGGVPVERTGLDGQRLTETDDSCDSALSTFTLCTVPDPLQALREVRRVLRPGGRLHVLEHGLAPDPGVSRWQHRLDPLQRRVCGGCHLSRDVPGLLADAGFSDQDVEASYLPGPAVSHPWVYAYIGSARAS